MKSRIRDEVFCDGDIRGTRETGNSGSDVPVQRGNENEKTRRTRDNGR